MNISSNTSNPVSNIKDNRIEFGSEYDKIDVVSELPGVSSQESFQQYNIPSHDKQHPYFSARSSISGIQQPLQNQFYTSNTANPSPASTTNNTPTNRQSINNFMINNPATNNNTPQHSNLPSPALSNVSSITNTTNNNKNPFNFPSRRFSSVDSTSGGANNPNETTVHPYYTPQGLAPRRLNSSSNSAFSQVPSTTSSPSNVSHPPLPPVSSYWKSRSNSLPNAEQMQNRFGKFNSSGPQNLHGRSDCPAGIEDPREPVDPAFAAQLAAAEAEDEAWRKAQKLDDQHNPVPDFSDFIKG